MSKNSHVRICNSFCWNQSIGRFSSTVLLDFADQCDSLSIVYRSWKFHRTKWNCWGAIWGTVFATSVLGILWNVSQGADAKYGWYDNFVHMPLYGALFGGYLGWLMGEQILGKASKNIRPWLFGFSLAIALAAFYAYLYTGAISYGAN